MASSRWNRSMQTLGNVAQWPPLVYFILGVVCLGFWGAGTSIQVLTSQSWILGQELEQVSFSPFGQIIDFISGNLKAEIVVPFGFAWGVQLALVVTSIGIELPRRPAWRYWSAVGATFVLIGANSCGDFFSSAKYGLWGQLGFTAAILFLTFCMLLFAIMSFKRAFELMN